MKTVRFKNSSKLLSQGTLFLLMSIFSSGNDLYADPGIGTGLIPLSAEEWKAFEETTLKVVGVRPNKIGAQRLEKYFASEGEASPPIAVATSFEEELITSLEWSSEDLNKAKADPLPSSVDNSKLPSFPPVGNQGSLGACVGWATTYYGASHEIGLLNGYNNKTSFTNVLSPKWTYNLTNSGNDAGTYMEYGYSVLQHNGAASILQFPYDNDYKSWDLNQQHWIDAINNRMQPLVMAPGLSNPQNLSVIKGLLNNGHVLSIGTWVNSWNYTRIKADPANPNSPYVGQMACTYMNGRNGGHNISIVGYDDNIWIDVNGNGQVDPGERGAFLLCNSWGPNWGNKGFIWVSYDAFLQTSAVPNGPTAGRVAISQDWGNMAFSQMAKAPNYRPNLVGLFTLSQTKRNQIALQGALAGANDANPSQYFQNTALYNSGGEYAFNGTATTLPISGAFALDFTDLIPVSSTAGPKKYMLEISDTAAGNPTVLSTFSLRDYFHNKSLTNGQLINIDNSKQYSSLTYDYYGQPGPDQTAPQVAITSPRDQEVVSKTIQVIANATDNVGVSKVEFYVDGKLTYTDTTTPYLFSLDTTTLTAGNHNLNALAYDASNNTASSAIAINVQNAGPDQTAPQLEITSPKQNEMVSKTIQVTANATDNVGISKVEFYMDGDLVATDTTSPYMFSLDTTTLAPGNHLLSALAYDTSNNTSSKGITIIVQNSAPDLTVPQVAITSHMNGEIVSKTIQIVSSATDNVGISKVEFYVDGKLQYTDTAAPYTLNLDTLALTDGTHSITVVAYDPSNNKGSSSLNLNVQNACIGNYFLNVGGPSVTYGGVIWMNDAPYLSGDSILAVNQEIPFKNSIYNSQRYGKKFTYTFPVPNGNYEVTLKFAEIYWKQPGQRKLNVNVNGVSKLSGLDVFALVGYGAPYDATFPVSVVNGKVVIEFTAAVDNAIINGIQITHKN